MEVLSRIVGTSGIPEYYKIFDGSGVQVVDSATALFYAKSGMLSNVVIVGGNYLRAKTGYKIDTIVMHSTKLLPRPVINSIQVQNMQGYPYSDCHGFNFINICRVLRRLALEDKFEVDLKPYKANYGNNIHLFKAIESCGITVYEFVRKYLYNIQPYSLDYFDRANAKKSDIWVADLGYGVRFIIKVSKPDKLVISFHESNMRGTFVSGGKDFSNRPCIVLTDMISPLPNGYSASFTVQRGFIDTVVTTYTDNYQSGYTAIPYFRIYEQFRGILQGIMGNIITYYGNNIDPSFFTITEKGFSRLTFMSLGYAGINNIVLLIDLFSSLHDNLSRASLMQLVIGLLAELPLERVKMIQTALKSRNLGKSNALCDLVMGVGNEEA